LARGTGTKSPIAPSQNPRKFRSYESILATLGIKQDDLFCKCASKNRAPIMQGQDQTLQPGQQTIARQ